MAVPDQLDLFDAESTTPEAFAAHIGRGVDVPVRLTFTRNRVSVASVSFSRDGSARVRLHQEFLNAPLRVRDALCRYLARRHRPSWDIVAAYARGIAVPESAAKPRVSRLATKGRVYDLGELRAEVMRERFLKPVSCAIGWGRSRTGRRGRRSRSIRFGSWSASSRTIRVHPALDDARVPREFVKYIIFHEMLHAVVPPVLRNGRRYDHGPEFRTLERAYPGFERMRQLSHELLDLLG